MQLHIVYGSVLLQMLVTSLESFVTFRLVVRGWGNPGVIFDALASYVSDLQAPFDALCT